MNKHPLIQRLGLLLLAALALNSTLPPNAVADTGTSVPAPSGTDVIHANPDSRAADNGSAPTHSGSHQDISKTAAAEKATKQETSKTSPPSAEDFLSTIKSLVLEFYPRAKTTVAANALHFEDKVKKGTGYYSGKPELAPLDGGILCDISTQDGEYNGADKSNLGSELPDGYHTKLTMAPYSPSRKQSLLARVLMPSDASEDFKLRFRAAVNKWNEGENEGPSATLEKSAAQSDSTAGPSVASAASVPGQALLTAPPAPPVPKPAKPVDPPKPPGYDAAVKLFYAKKWALAQKEFEKFIKDKTDDTNTHAYLAYCYYNERQYTKALAQFGYVADHSPHNLTLQRSAEGSIRKLRCYMTGVCPMDCLKVNDPRWRPGAVGSRYMHVTVPGGWAEITDHHLGELVTLDADGFHSHGKCPVCGGTGTVPVLHNGDPLP